jgi:predicted DCC family thiol-disulfide oxidoreductase YuxK
MNPKPVLILFFDKDCLLCSRSVQWLIRHDKSNLIHFAPLQGETAKQSLPESYRVKLNSVVLKTERGLFIRSSAILALCPYLHAPWSWLGMLKVIPAPLSDLVYRFIARNRKRLFKGDATTCLIGYENRILK